MGVAEAAAVEVVLGEQEVHRQGSLREAAVQAPWAGRSGCIVDIRPMTFVRRWPSESISGEPAARFVGEICGLLDIVELRRTLLVALQPLLPSDYISLKEVGTDPEQVVAIIELAAPEGSFERWAALADENPLLRRYLATSDGRPYRFSDVIAQRDLHRLPLYREVYEPMGVEHQLAFILTAGPTACWRSPAAAAARTTATRSATSPTARVPS